MKNVYIFYVGWLNINDTYNLFPSYLKNFDEVNCIDINKMSYEEIKENAQNAQLIVIDRSVFSAHLYQKNTVNLYIKNFVSKDFYKSVWDYLLSQKLPKVLIASGQDLHWIELEEGFEIYKNFQGIAWFYEKKPPKKDKVPEFLKDSWMEKTGCPQKAWKTIRSIVPSRFEMSHFLEKKNPFKRKWWDLSICGVQYAPRRIALDSVKNSPEISVAPFLKTSHALNIIFKNYFKPVKIKLRQQSQQFLLSHSLISFVCGSAYKYPVRKFFEVAASNSLLLSLPFNGFEHFGFKVGKNCIEADLENINLQIEDIKKNKKHYINMAENLQDNIYSLHNIHDRSKQFIVFLKYIYNGTNVIAEFKEGNFNYCA